MSRSVTIPSPSPRSTTTQVAPASTICCGRSLHRRIGRADQRRGANQLADRPSGGRLRVALVARQQPNALRQRPYDEAHGGGALEHRSDRVLGDPVDERVLGGPRDEPERLLLEQGGEPEHLALAEQVQKATLDHQLDGAAPDDVRGLGGGGGAVQDRRSSGVALDLGARRDGRQLLLVQGVERGMVPEELGDLVLGDLVHGSGEVTSYITVDRGPRR